METTQQVTRKTQNRFFKDGVQIHENDLPTRFNSMVVSNLRAQLGRGIYTVQSRVAETRVTYSEWE